MHISSFLSRLLVAVCLAHAGVAWAQHGAASESANTATTIYRQVTPDGRIVYSDQRLKGARVDETIAMQHPIRGNPWTAASGTRPLVVPRSETTPVSKVAVIPSSGGKRSATEATSEVIRAEMLLEDARKRQEAGVAPLAGERTGNAGGGSRLNQSYWARQQALAEETAAAEEQLRKARAEREALR